MAANAVDVGYVDEVGSQSMQANVSQIIEFPGGIGLDEGGARQPADQLERRLSYVWAKRSFDILFSVLLLMAALPLLAALAVFVRLTSPGPVIFGQKRCGRNGQLFTCYKFRTMVTDAELVLAKDDVLRASFAQQWKLVEDPRITSAGRFLRKTSLDELPQLWNVLKGDMSLVGPRPVQELELIECYADQARVVTSVRPGLTGLWQVSGRSSLSYEQRVALDVRYVRRPSLWLDILIILQTIPALMGSKDAC